mgnify:FL=1
MCKKLENKVAVITGGASGIGEATAKLFVENGAKVFLVDISEPNLQRVAGEIKAMGGEVDYAVCDVAKHEQCKAAVEKCQATFGDQIHVLVNSAGVLDKHRAITNCPPEFWQWVVGINLNGTYSFCHEILKIMLKYKEGSIVNVSSGAYLRANSGAAYTATKYAVVGLTKNMAIQCSPIGIRVNAICPGVTMTPMNDPKNLAENDQEFGEICFRHIDLTLPPLDAIDQAKGILYFACDDSHGVTGQVIGIDNGVFL